MFSRVGRGIDSFCIRVEAPTLSHSKNQLSGEAEVFRTLETRKVGASSPPPATPEPKILQKERERGREGEGEGGRGEGGEGGREGGRGERREREREGGRGKECQSGCVL